MDLDDEQQHVDTMWLPSDREQVPEEERYYVERKFGWNKEITAAQRNECTEEQVNEYFAKRSDPKYASEKLKDIEATAAYAVEDKKKIEEANQKKRGAKGSGKKRCKELDRKNEDNVMRVGSNGEILVEMEEGYGGKRGDKGKDEIHDQRAQAV